MPTPLGPPTTSSQLRARHNNVSRWPLLVIKFDGDATDEEYAASLLERTTLLRRREKYAVLLDASTCGDMPARQRKLEADWTRQNHEMLAQYLVGIAFVFKSPVLRAALTAIFWLQPFSWPYEIMATLPEAELWATERLLAVGQPVPPTMPVQRR